MKTFFFSFAVSIDIQPCFIRYLNDSAEAISSIMTEVEMAKNILLLMRKLFDNFQLECGKFNQN